jgi:hypothetical protein
MTQRYLSAVLIFTLGFILGTPANAQTSSGTIGGVTTGVIVGVAVGVAAGVAVVVIVAIHYSKKRSITGCINSQGSGLTVTDEKDNQIYALSGSLVGITPGDRMRLEGKKVKSSNPGNTYQWETTKVAKDFGVCRP